MQVRLFKMSLPLRLHSLSCISVLRKRGKLISFLRAFFTTRPARTQLQRTGIMKQRIFGCDLGEHLLNSGLDGNDLIKLYNLL